MLLVCLKDPSILMEQREMVLIQHDFDDDTIGRHPEFQFIAFCCTWNSVPRTYVLYFVSGPLGHHECSHKSARITPYSAKPHTIIISTSSPSASELEEFPLSASASSTFEDTPTTQIVYFSPPYGPCSHCRRDAAVQRLFGKS